MLFRLKRHEVIEALRYAAVQPSVWRQMRKELKEKGAEAKAAAATAAAAAAAATTTTATATISSALAACSHRLVVRPVEALGDLLVSLENDAEFERLLSQFVRRAKALALRVLREELAPLALEAEPESYELFRSTLLLLNEVDAR